MPEPMLEIRDLHAYYGESHVLHGVSLSIPAGEVVTLLGRNGAGKTTTLRSIMGIVPRAEGSIRLEGRELVGQTPFRIARQGIGFVPEERGIFASLDVQENLMLPPQVRPGGMSVEEIFTLFPNLRDRLRSQGRVPRLPDGWHLETVLRPAFGDSFSGDFVVATRSDDGALLELVLVDVSGKGQSAGTRALALSGALGGLLGAMPEAEFLPAANAYLLRQDWPEGFATAVHVVVDLPTGAYRVRGAGHPPVATGAPGRAWRLVEGDAGPALGLVPGADFPAVSGALGPGEAMVFYTDGMVEVPGEDLSVGIGALVDLAGEICAQGCSAGDAERLVEGAHVAESDDRALVLLWRS